MDWNNDGKKDLIAGDTAGNVWVFLNTGTNGKPDLAEGRRLEVDGKPITAARKTYKKVEGKYVVDKIIPGSHPLSERYTKIHFADWDADGLKDLLVGHIKTIIVYKNIGTKSAPRFRAPTLINVPKGGLPVKPSPHVIDWDGDGTKDLLMGSEKPKIYFYRNIGTNKQPQLARGEILDLRGPGFDVGYRCRIDVTDWNNDGKLDLLVGNRFKGEKPSSGGNIWLFLGK
ncbi:MAG: VCBS repeat-containing protein [Desulfobacterales bacterium]